MLSKELLSETVQRFIHDHENEDPKSIVLKQKMVAGVPASIIADQLSGRKKAKEKLPLYYNASNIIFPPSLNLEQSSSQHTAQFKTDLIVSENLTRYNSCADLTGGFGVDSFFFSRIFKNVHYVDPDKSILEIASHNHSQLGATNIQYHEETAEAFLRLTDSTFDLVYVDPSRRRQGNKKVYTLSDSEPNVVELKDFFFKKAKHVLIKASPLLDIQLAIRELKQVKTVIVLSVRNECKELLFLLGKDLNEDPLIQAINILADNHIERFDFFLQDEKNASTNFSSPLGYLYEPNASIMKAGAFKRIGSQYNLSKIHPSTHLYTSSDLLKNFPGRIFKIDAFVKPEIKTLINFFPDKKANVITRNYPLSVEDLKKKSGLKDGGSKYLIGFTGTDKKYLVVGERIFLTASDTA